MSTTHFTTSIPSRLKERPRDVVSSWTAFRRTLQPLRVIAHPSLQGPYTPTTFLEAVHGVQHEVSAAATVQARSVGIWRMEKIGYSYCRDRDHSLNDAEIPRSAQPVLHVGLGIAAAENALFEVEKVVDLIESQTHPDYRPFPYESLGCIWAVYANRMFKTIFRVVSATKLPKCDLPPWNEFVGSFESSIQRVIAHGYGRTLYFKNYHVGRAIREAVRSDGLDVTAAVQGIAFAYVLLNHRDLDRILEVGQDLSHPLLSEAFGHGLIYALAFLEWTYPGFLEHWAPSSNRQASLKSTAWELVAEGQRLGRFPTFGIV